MSIEGKHNNALVGIARKAWRNSTKHTASFSDFYSAVAPVSILSESGQPYIFRDVHFTPSFYTYSAIPRSRHHYL